jgi:hypothetical protein
MAKKKAPGNLITDEYRDLAQATPRMTVLADGAIESGTTDLDSFNLPTKLAPVFDILRHPNTRTPLAISIYGDWGSGKTSAMRWVDAMLREWNTFRAKRKNKELTAKIVRPVWFYPWKYHDRDDVWRGLVSEVILESIDVRSATAGRVRQAVKQFGIFLGRSFLHALSNVKLKAGAKGVAEGEFNFAALRDIYDEYRAAAHPEKAYLNEFEESLRSWINETISKSGERMVIFIDDLDRCLPEVALEVLEAIKLYLNIPDLVFVIGVDRSVIDELVAKHYIKLGLKEDKSRHYLAKMFQVEVTMGPSEVQVEQFLDAQLDLLSAVSGDYWNEELDDPQRDVFRDVLLSRAKGNPREVKRLLNSMLIHGAGAVHVQANAASDSSEPYSFAQGVQAFLVRRIAEEDYTKAKLVDTRVGNAFFCRWSGVVAAHPEMPVLPNAQSLAQPLTEKDERRSHPGAHPAEKAADRTRPTEPAIGSDHPYHEILSDSRFGQFLEFLEDEQLGRLMEMAYPEDASGLAATPADELSEALIREAIARQLEKPADDLTDDDLKRVKSLLLMGTDVADLRPLSKLAALQELDLEGTQVADVEGMSL